MARQSAKEALLPPSFQPLTCVRRRPVPRPHLQLLIIWRYAPPSANEEDRHARHRCSGLPRPAPPTSTRRRTARWLFARWPRRSSTEPDITAAPQAMPYPCRTVWSKSPPTPGTDCPTWRIDANAAVPQPDGHGKRFQEQDTFDPDCALEVALDVRPAPHGPMLCLYQHKEWWMRRHGAATPPISRPARSWCYGAATNAATFPQRLRPTRRRCRLGGRQTAAGHR